MRAASRLAPRLLLSLVAVALALTCLPGFVGSAAAATGSISGRVTNQEGEGVYDTYVGAWTLVSGTWERIDYTYSDHNGDYALTGLTAGNYRVMFANEPDGYSNEWWDDALTRDDATDVTVADGVPVTGIDPVLDPAAHLTGTVTDLAGDPIGGMRVTQYYLGSDGQWHEGAGEWTSGSGLYDIDNVEPGTYRLQFRGTSEYAGEFWENSARLEDATDIAVTKGEVVTRDAQLERTSVITGTVTGPNGQPMSGLQVRAYRFNDYLDSWSQAGSFPSTDASGHYQITGLVADTYRIEFRGGATTLDEWWENASSRATATDVPLGPDTEVVRNAQLAASGRISGQVTGVSGPLLFNSRVELWVNGPGGWHETDWDEFGTDGHFAFADLDPGQYRLRFPGNSAYFGEWWDNAPSAEAATTIQVDNGSDLVRNASLTLGGRISGRVTDAAGQPLDAVVRAYREDDGVWVHHVGYSTAEDGTYTVWGLPTGDYRLRFESNGYQTEWHDDVVDEHQASVVHAVEETVVPGQDAVLDTTSSISGRVTSTAGAGVSATLYAYRYVPADDGWTSVFINFTSSDGHYVIDDLEPGVYRLNVRPFGGSYLGEWWRDAPDIDSAQNIVVGGGVDVTGKDVVLAAAGHLTGTVTNGAGGGLNAVTVQAYRQRDGAWRWVRTATTGAAGTYDIGGLEAGSYRVRFIGGGAAGGEWWQDVEAVGDASDVVIPAGGTVSGIDAVLGASGGIAGQVSDPLDAPLEGVMVDSYIRLDGEWAFDGRDYTDANGDYTITGLSPGTHTVRFVDPDDEWAWEYWNDATQIDAQTFHVAAGEVVDDKDVSLVASSGLEGHVTTSSGAPDPDAEVQAYRLEGEQWLYEGYAETDADGDYDMPGLVEGTYRIYLYDPARDQGEWWEDAATRSTATDVLLGTSAVVGDIDAQLGSTSTPTFSNSAAPTVTGMPQVGSTLTALPGSWLPSDASFTYEWLQNGAPIAGAVTSSLLLTEDHLGSVIKARVTAHKDGYAPSTAASEPTAAVNPQPVVNSVLPAITGPAQVGKRLTANPGTWTPSGVDHAYQWLSNGVAIPGATAATYLLLPGQVGRAIAVRVTGSKGALDSTVTSAATAAVAPGKILNATKPALTGKAKVGKTLTVGPGRWTPAAVRLAYAWYVNGKAVAAATARTFKLKQKHLGKTLTCKVTAAAAGYTSLGVVTAGLKVK